MEVSGVNRLLSLARELGVETAEGRQDTRVERSPAPEARSSVGDGDGVRVSLSQNANAQLDAAAPKPSLPEAGGAAPNASLDPSLEVSRSPRQRQAIAAYARNAAATTGERIRIRA
mgnify:CR=1 FL=1